MKQIDLDVEVREVKSKAALHQARNSGRLPGVVYGAEKKPVAVTLSQRVFEKILREAHGGNVLLNLKIDGKTGGPVIVKEVQKHPTKHTPVHVDFQRVSLKEKVEVPVALHVRGEAPGVKKSGGVLEHLLREVRVRCLPTEIPSELLVDVGALEIGHGLRLKDVAAPAGVEILDDAEKLVVNIVAPTELKEEPAPAAAEAAAAEPEVIKKGKTEEGAEGAEAPKAEAKKAESAPAKAAPPKKEEKK